MQRIAAMLLTTVVTLPLFPSSAPSAPPATAPTPRWDKSGQEESDEQSARYNGPPVPAVVSHRLSGSRLPKSLTGGGGSSPVAVPQKRSGKAGLSAAAIPSTKSYLYTADASNLVNADVEPSMLTFTKNAIASTIEVFSHWDGSNYNIRTARTTNLTSSAASFSGAAVYVPTGYNASGDPMVAANTGADGIRPGTVYATGFTGYRPNTTNAAIGNPMSIRIWPSDDAGATWGTGQTVAYTQSADTYTLDKPVLDVSQYAGTRGYIYVAWVEVTSPAANWRIQLRRNTNGLWTRCRPATGGCDTAWDPVVTIYDGSGQDYPEDPQVVVNPQNGNVYVFWLDGAGRIQMRRSTTAGASFGPVVTVVNGIPIIQGTLDAFGNPTGILPNGLRGGVVPTIRYNTAAQNVMASWHTRTQAEPTNETAIYFTSFNADTIAGPVTQIRTVTDAAGSQLQPAMDNDAAGNVVIAYFSTEAFAPYSMNDYQLFSTAVTSSGDPIFGCGGCGPTASEPYGYANTFIGDYHNVQWFPFTDGLGARWNTAWSRSTYDFDAMATGIQ